MYELTMSLNPKSKTPLYEQIYEFIKEEIQNNVIQSGERLPSTRALSKHLVVSRSTVELAYEQLLSEGYVEAIPCKGYFVAKIEGIYQLQKRPEIKVDWGILKGNMGFGMRSAVICIRQEEYTVIRIRSLLEQEVIIYLCF